MEKYTGRVMNAETASEGMNSAVALILETEFDKFFVKGLKRAYPRRWTQDMEWTIGPYVASISPRVQWRVEEDEHWDLIGFEYIDGRHADYTPGSEDLPKIEHTMAVLGRISCPSLDLKTAESRWKPYILNEEDLHWLVGDRLLHTDYNPLNVLISDGRALLIDWAWPTKGAGWIDPACMILRLIAGGHTAEQAETVFRDLPAWQAAPAEGLKVFAEGCVNMWTEISEADSAKWKMKMQWAAHEWLSHRLCIGT
ncbi:hypothetical protein [Nonomuraea gerenzanensis]|uniref:Aminoglycoside phosphotransferase n=1 Tax=Nonomuraea gerenzanensis TaxID=93944 RepID=A0A1M4DVJ0_9ACTN|nr:hypothetical protein [Nonomuraea gerenzanensis]UBU12937.1 hypothetical protein LCN96_53300 [Nonomuraea gerenzanensis]SBO90579.1 hypothetical protein BN4615_P93 [Nonomuraea gerenzanensis]